MPGEAVDRVGTVIDGRYKVTELMASGSMGSVYKAERIPVGKLVAVKFLHASFAQDSEFQARFERETRVMSKLNHPNCVSVLDFGVWEEAPYLVMDYVEGTTLRHRLDKVGRLPSHEALALARQMLSGLAHAHAQDIYHRDVKPANVMISEEIGHGERVRILDFGLARLQGNVGRDATQINMVVGTPNYMAPEQTVPGGSIDGRTDLYAVGVVIFEMVAGERPFAAEDTLQLLGMHRAAPIPRLTTVMKKAANEVLKGTQELIDKAMAKSPDARYQTAIEFAQAIDDVLEGKFDPTIEEVPSGKSGKAKAARRTGGVRTTGLAPTVVHLDNSAIEAEERRIRTRRSFGSSLIFALFLVGGLAAATGYLIKRSGSRNKPAVTDRTDTAKVKKDGGVDKVVKASPDAAVKTTPPADAPTVVAVAPQIDAAPAAPPDAFVKLDEQGLPIYGEPDKEEEQVDPEKVDVDDPNHAKAQAAQEEAPNAPKTVEEAEKREQREPKQTELATNLHDAVNLIKAGKNGAAVASLQQLWKKSPKSAYIPFLLGNLYFDRVWWSVAMDHYRAAIRQNPGYKRNPVLNRNVIRMLASGKTRQAATNFLRGVIGRFSAPHLRWAARNDPNPVVRRQAATLSRYIR